MSSNGRARVRNPIFVPGNRRSMLEKAISFATDAVVADLEDSVPMAEKPAARDLVVDMIPALARSGQRTIVRVNSLNTGLGGGRYIGGRPPGRIRSQRWQDHLAGRHNRVQPSPRRR